MSDHFQKLNSFGREGSEHEVVNGVPALVSPFKEMGRAELRDGYASSLEGSARDEYGRAFDRAAVKRLGRYASALAETS